MGNTNKKIGNDFESQFCEILFDNGFWAHNLAQNSEGQPADVIAARNGKTYLIDCKVCSNRGFALSRVEENQDLSMSLWESCGNGTGWFSLLLPGDRIYMISHGIVKQVMKEMTYLNEEFIHGNGIPLETWMAMA